MLRDVAAQRLDQLESLPEDVGRRIRGSGVRLHGAVGARAVRRAHRTAPRPGARPVRRRPVARRSRASRPRTSPPTARWSATSTTCSRSGWPRADPGRVDEFLAKHGRFFPGARTLDDIVEQLTERMAAMQSLLRSMTPEQRAELQSMMDALLRDDRLRWDLARLAANIDAADARGPRRGLRPAASSPRPGGRARADRPAAGDGRARGRARRHRDARRPDRDRPPRSATCWATTRCSDLDALDDLAQPASSRPAT